MKTGIAAIVVLYNPDKKFIDNIHTYAAYVSLLVVVDNSETPDKSLYDPLRTYPGAKFIINNQNNGIARAVNDGVKYATSLGFEWALLMDQDSFFEEQMIIKYLADFEKLKNKDKVAVLGPISEKRSSNNLTEKINHVSSLITSGSLVNVPVFNASGGYDEKLFIDEVDHEYCYRVKLKNYDVLEMQDIFLQHTLGKLSTVKTLAGENKLKSFHSPIRLYYIVRNCCFIIHTYKKTFPEEMRSKRKDLFVRIKNNLLYGEKRLAACRYIILGFIHYKTNRFGKLQR